MLSQKVTSAALERNNQNSETAGSSVSLETDQKSTGKVKGVRGRFRDTKSLLLGLALVFGLGQINSILGRSWGHSRK